MIVIDSSAVVAILLSEEDAAAYQQQMVANACQISAMSVLETEIVMRRRVPQIPIERVRELLNLHRVSIAPFDDRQARLASEAYARFGKGFHLARLNMGDCAAYALAETLDAPLLYKGRDFAATDIRSALT